MKISKLFHTLYGCLMALPVFVIPIFAININQKEVEPISIELQEKKQINFNQLIENGNFSNDDFWNASANANLTINNNEGTLTIKPNTSGINIYAVQNTAVLGNITHKYLIKFTYSFNEYIYDAKITYSNGSTYVNLPQNTTSSGIYQNIFTPTNEFTLLQFKFSNSSYLNVNAEAVISNVQLFDLSQMFGLNNEPSISEFNNYFTNQYYDFTLSHNELINDYVITYNNTDIGSQFLYSIYKPVNDYFNFKDFMGLGSLYDWIQLNIFSGSNSLVFFILFNFFTYWIFVSFFWLIFDVLMYVPSLVHKMLDKARLE